MTTNEIVRCAGCAALIVPTRDPDVWIDGLREPHCRSWLNESESGVEHHRPSKVVWGDALAAMDAMALSRAVVST